MNIQFPPEWKLCVADFELNDYSLLELSSTLFTFRKRQANCISRVSKVCCGESLLNAVVIGKHYAHAAFPLWVTRGLCIFVSATVSLSHPEPPGLLQAGDRRLGYPALAIKSFRLCVRFLITLSWSELVLWPCLTSEGPGSEFFCKPKVKENCIILNLSNIYRTKSFIGWIRSASDFLLAWVSI